MAEGEGEGDSEQEQNSSQNPMTIHQCLFRSETCTVTPPNPINALSVCACSVASVASSSLQVHGLQPPGSSVYGILQARTLEWVAISSSRGPSWPGINPCPLCLLCWHVGSLLPANCLGSPGLMLLPKHSAPFHVNH